MPDDFLTLVTGEQLDLRVLTVDDATGVITTADGSQMYPDGTIVKGTTIVLPSGNVVDASSGVMTLPDGTQVQAASQDPGALAQIQTTVSEAASFGVTLADAFRRIVGAVGVGGSTVLRPGYTRLPDGTIRMPDGSIVTPTVLADGRLMLPNGTVLPANFGGGFGFGLGGTGLLLAAGVGLLLLGQRRRSR